MDINAILENEFNCKVKIIQEIQSGLRCKTFLIESNNTKYIFQIYLDNTIYQAKKKYNILNLFNNELIPKAIKVKVNKNYAYLITEYKEGKSLTYYFNRNISIKEISIKLAKVLTEVHSVKNNTFGWITDTGIIKNANFIDYIKSEYERLNKNLGSIKLEIRKKILNKVNAALEIIQKRSMHISEACLCWYDINPDNLLINRENEKLRLNGLIDPGGARYGIREWDLAFVKMELCKNKNEFEEFIMYYKSINKDYYIDEELINALSVIVELDDISIRIIDNIIIDIPYDTKFKREIEFIHKNIKETSCN